MERIAAASVLTVLSEKAQEGTTGNCGSVYPSCAVLGNFVIAPSELC